MLLSFKLPGCPKKRLHVDFLNKSKLIFMTFYFILLTQSTNPLLVSLQVLPPQIVYLARIPDIPDRCCLLYKLALTIA